jgi:KDO2-lipid IV(A) lauroyltransferase
MEQAMIYPAYRDDINGLKRSVFDGFSSNRNSSELKRRIIMSASLSNLLPGIARSSHEKIIDNILFYQQWAVRDQYYAGLVDELVVEGEVIVNAEKPTIYCSYHMGSYRLLIPYLISKHVKFTLLIDSQVAQVQGGDFAEAVRRAVARFDASADCCRIIDTSHSSILFSMARELKQNRSLVVFIDGNSGVHSKQGTDENLVEVDFLGQTLMARQGIARISQLTGASITPAIMHRTNLNLWENRLKFFAPIFPTVGLDPGAYVRRATACLYAILEEYLHEFYEQWESWGYVEKSLMLSRWESSQVDVAMESLEPQTRLCFDTSRYSLTQPGSGEHLLFDRRHYRSTFISEAFTRYLEQFLGDGIKLNDCQRQSQFSASLLSNLLRRGILRPLGSAHEQSSIQ